MNSEYEDWLSKQGYASNTRTAQLYRVQKVEQCYGSLDDLLANGGFDEMISELTYSKNDERAERKNPSRIEFSGVIRTNLASYKGAANRYRQYWTEPGSERHLKRERTDQEETTVGVPVNNQKLALERDLQNALRINIAELDAGLTIVDDGVEHSVSSGFIDILCEDEQGSIVVIELKAGTTDSRVVAQTLGYMGDMSRDDPEGNVRGLIVAHEFDKRTKAAVHAVPNLELITYSVTFQFHREK